MPLGPVRETKRTLDGRSETFVCTALHFTPRLALVRFDHPGERRAGGFYFPAGSHTLGYFWRARPYNCYRIAGSDGGVIAYRFDVVERVRINPAAGHLWYHDLVLDLWRTPDGAITVEDQDEVDAARAAGLLSERQQRTIARVEAFLLRAHERIVAEVERLAAEHQPG
jgi:hypothetical protein